MFENKGLFSYDDAFFNRNWAGACGGRWVGPGVLADKAVGCRIVGAEVGSPLLLFGRLWMWYSPARTKKRGVGEGFARGRSDA